MSVIVVSGPKYVTLFIFLISFRGEPLMECCCVDDMSPENTIIGFPPSSVENDVCRLYISISPLQQGGTRAPSRSPAVSWWLERYTDSLVMILLGI